MNQYDYAFARVTKIKRLKTRKEIACRVCSAPCSVRESRPDIDGLVRIYL
jgi:hypothetical protein